MSTLTIVHTNVRSMDSALGALATDEAEVEVRFVTGDTVVGTVCDGGAYLSSGIGSNGAGAGPVAFLYIEVDGSQRGIDLDDVVKITVRS